MLNTQKAINAENITSGQENSLSRFLKLLAMGMWQKMN